MGLLPAVWSGDPIRLSQDGGLGLWVQEVTDSCRASEVSAHSTLEHRTGALCWQDPLGTVSTVCLTLCFLQCAALCLAQTCPPFSSQGQWVPRGVVMVPREALNLELDVQSCTAEMSWSTAG
jgi:hypothetical protein